MKIIRTGSCITLLSDFVPIEAKTFFRMLYFEGYAKYVFWTFNDNFIIDLSRNILLSNEDNVKSCIEVLRLYPKSYDEKLNNGEDSEISFCYRKILSLKKDRTFDQMFALDVNNIKAVLRLLEERMDEMKKSEENEKDLSSIETEPANHEPVEISFLDMIIPVNGNIENTLSYLESKIIEARFPHNIFHTISKTKKGANQTALNSEIAAMVNVFQDNGFFKREFTFKEIYKSFGIYTQKSGRKGLRLFFFCTGL